MALALGIASWTVILCAVAYGITGHITTGFGLMAVACAVGSIGFAVSDSPVGAACDAAFTALFAWLWWTHGGGDGTKRRLRHWARKFHGVRRTAPAAGAA